MLERRVSWSASSAVIASMVLIACPETSAPPPLGDNETMNDVAGDSSGSGCIESTECDDGVECTLDQCIEGSCSWSIEPTQCFVNGACREEGAVVDCGVCAPSASQISWSPAPNGTVCNDEEPCTTEGICVSGVCQTEAATCDDSNDCTIDSCDTTLGCQHQFKTSGSTCTAGSKCFATGTCADGSCQAKAISCDDGNPCTIDSCDPLDGCMHVNDTGTCSDGDACTTNDSCNGGKCVAGQPTDCNDGNSCTIDSCHPLDGCSHLEVFSPCCTGLVSVCDDGNPCTNDECDPLTKECSYTDNTAPCDDHDECTEMDACSNSACAGNPVNCSDGNDCTLDQCAPDLGCDNIPISGTFCDDGLACSSGDTCVVGECMGDTTNCTCVPDFSQTASKLTSVALGDGGYVGEALDVDKNPATCAPQDACSNGIDNAFSALAEVAMAVANVDINDEMAVNTKAGWIMLVVELRNVNQPDFSIALYQAKLDPANKDCDFQNESCSFWALPEMLDDQSCQPKALLPAVLDGKTITAGGQGTELPFEIPFQGGVMLNLVLYDLTFEGTVDLSGDAVVSFDGVLGAAIPKEDLEAAILSLPAGALGGIEPADALPLLSLALEYDMNVPGKGPASSIGLKFQGIGATMTGVAP